MLLHEGLYCYLCQRGYASIYLFVILSVGSSVCLFVCLSVEYIIIGENNNEQIGFYL